VLTDKQKQVIDEFLFRPAGSLEYPGSIEKLTRKNVSRVWAKTICDRLTRARVLEEVKARSPTKARPTSHYRLKPGIEGVRNLVRPYFRYLMQQDSFSWQKGAGGLMGSDYLRQQLNEDLVKKVLSSKGVTINRCVSLGEGRTSHFIFLPVSRPGSRERPKHSFLNDKPVLSQEEAKQLNGYVDSYYAEGERKSLLIPILALIEASPSALAYFLGKWSPYITDTYTSQSSSNGADMIEHVLFRLIWGALSDFSVTRGVPEGSDVKVATVRSGFGPARETERALLTLNWRYEAKIEYDAGFDTETIIYGDELYQYEKNPENAWVSISWREDKHTWGAGADGQKVGSANGTSGEQTG